MASYSEVPTMAPWIPSRPTLPKLIRAARECHGCDLYQAATQTVFGEGPVPSPLMMIGEQPGDVEDRSGAPFVGPAGKLLDKALAEAGIDRRQVYLTNAVKHFKFVERGKRRIHAKPNTTEIKACRGWLDAEMKIVRPELIVCLGATAAQSLLGADFRITQQRGIFLPYEKAKYIMATVHPSAILRTPDHDRREEGYQLFVQDLSSIPKRVAAVTLT